MNVNPRATPSMPRVAMNGGSCIRVTSTPLMSPTAAPTRIPTTTPSRIGRPAWDTAIVPSTPESPATEPTERSIPAVRMTSVWPTAMIATTETWTAMLNRLLEVKKYGEAMLIAITTTISPAAAANWLTTSPNRSRIPSEMRRPPMLRGAALTLVLMRPPCRCPTPGP